MVSSLVPILVSPQDGSRQMVEWPRSRSLSTRVAVTRYVKLGDQEAGLGENIDRIVVSDTIANRRISVNYADLYRPCVLDDTVTFFDKINKIRIKFEPFIKFKVRAAESCRVKEDSHWVALAKGPTLVAVEMSSPLIMSYSRRRHLFDRNVSQLIQLQ